jgi:hypothetical protein
LRIENSLERNIVGEMKRSVQNNSRFWVILKDVFWNRTKNPTK